MAAGVPLEAVFRIAAAEGNFNYTNGTKERDEGAEKPIVLEKRQRSPL